LNLFRELQRRNVFRVTIGYVVSCWLLAQVADLVLENIGAPAWVMQTILLVLVLGFPVVVFFSWAYEVTPEGIKRESEVDRSQSITNLTGRKLDRAIIAVLIVALGYFIWESRFAGDRANTDPGPAEAPVAADPMDAGPSGVATRQEVAGTDSTRPSIAVLPFANRSNREEDQFFTDGIHDDLLTTIAKIGSMKVISRTSVMEYMGTTKKIPEIAEELGVAHVLEGGIQRAGDQVRINVQLIDAATDEHLWAEIYDRELTAENLFAIQSEISNAIAAALETTLTPAEWERISEAPTSSLEAYDAYLRGRQLMATARTEDLELALQKFEHAVELDPEFALAWVSIADAHDWITRLRDRIRTSETLAIREQAIRRALSIDPDLGEAWTAMATIHRDRGRDDEAESAFLKGIELSPNNANSYYAYATSIVETLRTPEKIDLIRKALELDPRSLAIRSLLAQELFRLGRYAEGVQQEQRVLEIDPDFVLAHHELGDHYLWHTGEFARSLAAMRRVTEVDPGTIDGLRHELEIYLEVGLTESARSVGKQIAALAPESRWPIWLEMMIALAENDLSTVRARSDQLISLTMNNAWGFELRQLGTLRLLIGDIHRARETFVLSDPGWLRQDRWSNLIEVDSTDTCIFSWILLNTGDPESGQALVDQTIAFLERDLSTVVEHVDSHGLEICYLTVGDTAGALEILGTQMDHNHIFRWGFYTGLPMYDAIRDEPRFIALEQEYDRRLRQQREAIEALDQQAAGGAP
jgi:TolB-like protein